MIALVLVSLLSPVAQEKLWLRPASGPWADAIAHYDFESSGAALCDDAIGLFDNVPVGSPLQETTSPIHGTGSMDSNTAGGCNTDWAGAPWNTSATNYTIAVAFDTADVATFQWIIDFSNLNTGNRLSIDSATGDLRWHGGNTVDTVDTSPEDNGTDYYCITWDITGSSPDAGSLYINAGSTPDYTKSGNQVNDNDFGIGVDKNGTIQHFSGLIDELWIWDRVLTGVECEQVNGGAP